MAESMLTWNISLIGDDTPSTTDVYVPFYFHKFLKLGDMQHLSPTEIRCLEREYCLQVPSGRVLDEFVRQYFLYVHPCLPLLNEGHFWALYSGSGRDGNCSPTFSLALFQAILFTACRVSHQYPRRERPRSKTGSSSRLARSRLADLGIFKVHVRHSIAVLRYETPWIAHT